MKHIKYHLKTKVNTAPLGEAPIWDDAQGAACTMPYTEENLKIAKAEAFCEVEVVDDGVPEPVPEPTQEERIAALEAAMLELVLGGVENG